MVQQALERGHTRCWRCGFDGCSNGRRTRASVLVLERNSRSVERFLFGGGRCNFTNEQVGKENYHSENEHFARSSLKRYQPRDFIELVESHHIAYHEKTLAAVL